MAQGMILSGMARNVLTVGVDMQSRLLDKSDRSAYFLFGDGAGAAIISAGTAGHRIRRVILGSDARGLQMARREEPGYFIGNGHGDSRPLDPHRRPRPVPLGHRELHRHHPPGDRQEPAGQPERNPLGRFPTRPTAGFSRRPPSAAASTFDRFYLNVEHVGNTSSASIPLALIEIEESLKPGDKLVLCAVGAGMTMAAIAVEW